MFRNARLLEDLVGKWEAWTRIEQKQEDWLLGKVEEMVGIGMLSSHCEL